jgi:putative zinc finger protein
MNCRRVQKLIPLHIEGDLQASAADRVESHLEWCGRCNWIADEYRDSQTWLHTAQPPDFDETFLDDLKRDVMKRVAENNARPSRFASLLQQWSRRQILALAAGFVVVLGVVALYFYQARGKGNPQMISEVVEQPRSDERKPDRQPQPRTAAGTAPGASSNKRHVAVNRRRNLRSFAGHSVVTAQAPKRTLVFQTNGTTETATAPTDQSDAQNGIANRTRDMLRIEIQTGDPSIRIIWFAPKETDLHQSKPATD